MGDDRAQRVRAGRRATTAGPKAGSSVLTPPDGVPAVVDSTREVLDAEPGTAAPAVPGDVRGPVAADPVVAPCVCGHGRDAHEHWRRGRDCGACGAGPCVTYRPRGGALRRLMRSFGLVP
jgi:hypothetical protein